LSRGTAQTRTTRCPAWSSGRRVSADTCRDRGPAGAFDLLGDEIGIECDRGAYSGRGESHELAGRCGHVAHGPLPAPLGALAERRIRVDPDDLATISPYIRENVRRFGEWVLDTTPPGQIVTRLDVTLAG